MEDLDRKTKNIQAVKDSGFGDPPQDYIEDSTLGLLEGRITSLQEFVNVYWMKWDARGYKSSDLLYMLESFSKSLDRIKKKAKDLRKEEIALEKRIKEGTEHCERGPTKIQLEKGLFIKVEGGYKPSKELRELWDRRNGLIVDTQEGEKDVQT